jgi:hypothetical protein
MAQKPSNLVKLVVLLTLMPICGIGMLIVAVLCCMQIGLYQEDNYELLFDGWQGIAILSTAPVLGALTALLLLWRWLGGK